MNDLHILHAPDILSTVGRRSKTNLRVSWLVRVAIVLFLSGVLVWGGRKYSAHRAGAEKPRFVTEPATIRDLAVTVGATGTLEGLKTVEVGSEVSGKIVDLRVDFNDVVKEGDILAIIDPEQSRAAVAEAEASVTSADATVLEEQATGEEAKSNVTRAEKQVREGLLSQQDYEALRAKDKRAEATLIRARASARLARASLKSAQSRLDKTVIVSPIGGIVQSRLVENGQTLTAGMETPVLFKITDDLRQMRLAISIDEADIGGVKAGQRAMFTVDAYPDRVFESEVLSIRNEPQTEQNVVTYEALLSVNNQELLLRPGMTATATIVTELKEKVLSVPNAAFRFSMPKPKQTGFGPPQKTVAAMPAGIWILQGETPVHVAAKAGATDGRHAEVISNEPITRATAVIVDMENGQ